MARVTIEKCLKNGIKDKFDLVLVASQRSKDLEKGKKSSVNEKVKNTLISLLEIETDKLSVDNIRNDIVAKYRKYKETVNNDTDTEDEQEELLDIYNEEIENEDVDDEDTYESETENPVEGV